MADAPLFSMRKKNGKVEEVTVGACAGVTLVRIVQLVLIGTGGFASVRFVPWKDLFALMQAAVMMVAG